MTKSIRTPQIIVGDDAAKPVAPSLRRRAFGRGSASVVPMVLTLHSGAALARSSNLISTISPSQAVDSEPVRCLDNTGSSPVSGVPGKYERGQPPVGSVNVLPSSTTYDTDAGRTTLANPGTMGAGGTFYTSTGQVTLPAGGGLFSATAFISFATRITVNTL